ncbi:MAG: ExbD/TolR family protein [Planctomycetota bacterium]
MKIPLQSLRDRASLEIQMTPLIDVVFLLLVFFVWTAGFQVAERLLPSRVSAETPPPPAKETTAGDSSGAASTAENFANEPAPAPEADFERLVIRIELADAGPLWRINGEPIASAAMILEKLRRIATITREVPVILHPDGDVPLRHVIQIFDAVRALGFSKVSMAASPIPATG